MRVKQIFPFTVSLLLLVAQLAGAQANRSYQDPESNLRTALAAVTISSFSPLTARVGDTVTIQGTNFNPTPSIDVVYFGGALATVLSATYTSLKVRVPAGATYAPLTLIVEGSVAQSTLPFGLTFQGQDAITSNTFSKVDAATRQNPYGIALGDLDGDGKLDLVVANYGDNSISVFRNRGTAGAITSGTFPTGQRFDVSQAPRAVALADIDGDGKLDVLVVNSSDFISILRNTSTSGTISLATRMDFSTGTGSRPFGVAVSDLDGDGKLDVVAANSGTFSVSVFRNISTIGSLSLRAPDSYAVATGPVGVAIGDIDRDGKPDLVVPCGTDGRVSILRNTSSLSGIAFAGKYDLVAGVNPVSVALGDLDGDQRLDIVCANSGGDNISVYRNTSLQGDISDYSFQPALSFQTGTTPYCVSLGDMNGDGKLDILVANMNSSGGVSVFRNLSVSGALTRDSFAPKLDFATGNQPSSVVTGDIDGDGRTDFAASNLQSQTVSMYWNRMPPAVPTLLRAIIADSRVTLKWSKNSEPDFSQYRVYCDTTPSPTAFVYQTSGGANDTSYTRTALANGTTYYFRVTAINTGNVESGFSNEMSAVPAAIPSITSVSPLEGSVGTRVRISGANFGATGGANVVYFGGARALVDSASPTSLVVKVPAGATHAPISITVGGRTGYSASPFVATFAGGAVVGSSSFASKVDFSIGAGSSPMDAAIGDLDGDGKMDLVVSNSTAQTVSVFRNTHSAEDTISLRSFATGARIDFRVGNGPRGLALTDIDGDGLLDIVVACYNDDSISVLINRSTMGSLAFPTTIRLATGRSPSSVAASDIDGDGLADIVVTNSGGGTVSVLKNRTNRGTISFAPKVDYASGNTPQYAILADLDGDGDVDLAVANQQDNDIAVFRNVSGPGTITLEAGAHSGVGATPVSIVAVDLDGDRKLDLVVANRFQDGVSVLRNLSTTSAIAFGTEARYTAGGRPSRLTAGDVDGDGKVEVLVAAAGDSEVGVLANTSSGSTLSLAPPVRFKTGNTPVVVKLGDIDGDGQPDVVAVNNGENSVSVLQNLTPHENTPPAAPILLSVRAGDGRAALTWRKNTERDFLCYRIYDSASSGAATRLGSTTRGISDTAYTVTGLTNGRLYNLCVAAVDSAGNESAKSNIISATPVGVPRITSVSRMRGPLDTAITINGSNFSLIPGENAVFFGGVRAGVSSAFSSSLLVTVPKGATYAPITVAVKGYSASSALPFVVTNAAGANLGANSFPDSVNLRLPSSPSDMALGDLDGDGNLDLVVANSGSRSLSIFRNLASPGSIARNSFAQRIDIPVGDTPRGLAIADVDADGKLDIVAISSGDDSVTVLRNVSSAGQIAFGARKSLRTERGPTSVSVADFDRDGKPDLVVTYSFTSFVSVYHNLTTAAGLNFADRVNYGNGIQSSRTAVGDIDRDTLVDLLVANVAGTNVLAYRNTSVPDTIRFSTEYGVASAVIARSIAVGDLDWDGKLDLVFTDEGNRSLPVLQNKSTAAGIGAGTFASPVNLSNTTVPNSLALADLDGDGKVDMVAGNNDVSQISLFRNVGDVGSITGSSFSPRILIPSVASPSAITLGDIDGDGMMDILVLDAANNQVSVLRNGSGNLTAPSLLTPGRNVSGVAIPTDFLWGSSLGASFYRLQVSTNSSFSPTVYDSSGLTTTSQRVTTLVGSTTYYWRVYAANASGTSAWSEAPNYRSFTTVGVPPPPAPTLVSPANGSTGVSTSPTLSWNVSTGATSYRLQVSLSQNFTSTVYDQSGLTSTSQQVTGLANNTPYYWRVNATNAGGTSAWSEAPNYRSFTTGGVSAPPAPTLVSPANGATGVSTSPTLSWNVSSGATSYQLQVSLNQSFSTTVYSQSGLTSTSQQVTGLTNNTPYYWRVNATNAGGTSAWSEAPNYRSFTTVGVPPPPAPTLVSPANGSTGVSTSPTLSWNVSSGATSYQLQVSLNQSFSTTVYSQSGLTSTSQQVTGLTNNTPYYWRVNATNAGGTSAWSEAPNHRNFTTVLVPPPAPTAYAATNVASASFTANWSSSSGATGYRLDVSTTNTFTSYVSNYQDVDVANVLNCNVSGLNAGWTYYYRVRAYNSGGTSSNSGTITALMIPAAPTLVSPADGAQGVARNPIASWTAATGAASYRLQVSTSSAFSTYSDYTSISVTSYQLSGLSYKTTYYWRVNATNSSGTSPWSDTPLYKSFLTVADVPPVSPTGTTAGGRFTAQIPYGQWVLMSVPYEITNRLAAPSLSQTLSEWQIYFQASGQPRPQLLPSASDAFVLGRGFWLKSLAQTSGSFTLNFGGGQTSLADSLMITLPNGWSIIGPPFLLDPSGWRYISGVKIWKHVHESGQDSWSRLDLIGERMMAFGGYAVYNSGPDRQFIFVRNGPTPAPDLSTPGEGWFVTLRAGQAEVKVGQHPGASEGLDEMDSPLPPVSPGSSRELAYVSRELSDDIRPMTDSKPTEWKITINPKVSKSLIVSNVVGLPPGWTIGITGIPYADQLHVEVGDTIAFSPSLTNTFVATLLIGPPESRPSAELPVEAKIYQNYPNPFNPTTRIQFWIGKSAPVSLSIHNTLGEIVATLVRGSMQPGTYEMQWEAVDDFGKSLPSGPYFVRLIVEGRQLVKKMLLLK
jgi:fibronectin type 3 domain-containing protein